MKDGVRIVALDKCGCGAACRSTTWLVAGHVDVDHSLSVRRCCGDACVCLFRGKKHSTGNPRAVVRESERSEQEVMKRLTAHARAKVHISFPTLSLRCSGRRTWKAARTASSWYSICPAAWSPFEKITARSESAPTFLSMLLLWCV